MLKFLITQENVIKFTWRFENFSKFPGVAKSIFLTIQNKIWGRILIAEDDMETAIKVYCHVSCCVFVRRKSISQYQFIDYNSNKKYNNNVVYIVLIIVLLFLKCCERHALAICPVLWQILHFALRNRHFALGWPVKPQLKQIDLNLLLVVCLFCL
jgi:hypothetical protein